MIKLHTGAGKMVQGLQIYWLEFGFRNLCGWKREASLKRWPLFSKCVPFFMTEFYIQISHWIIMISLYTTKYPKLNEIIEYILEKFCVLYTWKGVCFYNIKWVTKLYLSIKVYISTNGCNKQWIEHLLFLRRQQQNKAKPEINQQNWLNSVHRCI